MSHQDSADRRMSFSNLEGVFAFLLPPAFRLSDRHGNAVVEPRTLAAMAIVCWGWSMRRTLSQRMEEAAEVVARLFPDAQTASRQGVCQALRTCGEQILQAIVQHLQQELPRLKGHWTTAGRPTFAVDGTKFAAPRTVQNGQLFAAGTRPKKIRKKQRRKGNYQTASAASKAQTVQVLATVFWHLGSGLPACWKLAPSHGSEQQSAVEMISQLPPKARIVADAQYIGSPLWSAILDSQRSFVIRVGSNVTLLRRLDPTLKRDRQQVYHWPHHAQSRGLPPRILRLIAVQTPRGRMWLLSNEWDLSDRQVAELYRARWGIEVFFRTVKQHCGKAKLLCRTPANAQTELNWTLLSIWASLFTAKLSLHAKRTPIKHLSPTQVIDTLNQAIVQTIADLSPTKALDFTNCLKADESHRTTSKKSRKYPKKKQPPGCGPPRVLDATKTQIAAAKALL